MINGKDAAAGCSTADDFSADFWSLTTRVPQTGLAGGGVLTTVPSPYYTRTRVKVKLRSLLGQRRGDSNDNSRLLFKNDVAGDFTEMCNRDFST